MPRFRGLPKRPKRPSECTLDQLYKTELTAYEAKRDFTIHAEPVGKQKPLKTDFRRPRNTIPEDCTMILGWKVVEC